MTRTAGVAGIALLGALVAGCGGESAEARDGGGAVPAAAPDRPAAAPRPSPAPEPPPAAGAIYDRWETIGPDRGLPSRKVLSVLCEPDRVWAGTEEGLAELRDGKVVRVWGTADGLAHRVVTGCARSPETGDLWIATFGGLSRLSGGRMTTWTQTTSGLMNDVVYGVEAEGARVWCATASGLSRFEPARDLWAVYDHTNAVFHEPWIYAVAAGEGLLWAGVWGGGVVAHDPVAGTWREYRDPDGEMEVELVADDGPVHDITSSLSWSDGVLWQATYFGAARLERGRWRSFLKRDGLLPSDFVNAVRARGRWGFLSTDAGLCVTDGDHGASYRRLPDGSGEVRLVRPGRPPESRALASAPPHDFTFQCDARGREVWVATAAGLGHGTATGDGTLVPADGGREPAGGGR
jgi:ligand-binding sensor domain-containing protein